MAEPVRKSVYDVMLENLKLARRCTFIHRYIYICEHQSEEKIQTIMASVINKINNYYIAEKISGLLLLYPNYFIHVLDTCDTAFRKHLELIHPLEEHFITRGVLIAFYHHINQKFFDEWGIRKATPPILLEKIQAADMDDVKRYLQTCVFKVYNLCIELRQTEDPGEEQVTDLPLAIKIGEIVPFRMNEYLPEYNLIQFILNERSYYSLDYALMTESLLFDSRYAVEVWPVRADYVPYTVFEKEANPIPNLPNSVPKWFS